MKIKQNTFLVLFKHEYSGNTKTRTRKTNFKLDYFNGNFRKKYFCP